jgi:hypothetical protein
MSMINVVTSAGPFSYCTAYQIPNTSITYSNDGDGHFHQLAYIISGGATGEIRDTEDGAVVKTYKDKVKGDIVDMTPSQGKYHTTITGADGMAVIMFNPIPATRKLTLEIIEGSKTKTVTAGENRITIVCVSGPIIANDKTLETLQFAKVLPGQSVKLEVPVDCTCALVSEE